VKTETGSFYEDAVSRAVGRVASQLDDALDLARLARGATLSPFHFHRVFRGHGGRDPFAAQLRADLAGAYTPQF
jgi:AraC family transcriptional regulator